VPPLTEIMRERRGGCQPARVVVARVFDVGHLDDVAGRQLGPRFRAGERQSRSLPA